jgi:TPP-dependent pyruvate/acetoin dehydrogenase alpha subunit
MGHLAVIRIGINVGQLFKLAIILYIENAHVSIPQRLERQTTKLPQRAAAKSIAPIVAVPIGGGAMIVAWPNEGLIRSQ